MKVLDKVLKEIKPSKKEMKEFKKESHNFLIKLNGILNEGKAEVFGSIKKGTWLKGAHDVDVFVLFPYSYKKKSHKLGDILEKQLKKGFKKYERLHGSRDYFQVKKGNYVFEIVPILKIKKAEEAVNITDVSPLHAEWVEKNSNKKLRDDIRLAKKFCRAQRCYGAESYIKGFSGYVLEILVIYYGGFLELLKASQEWEDKEVIDPEGYYRGKDVLKEMNKSKIHSPLILIDPVDKERNAAASLSRKNFYLFQEKSSEFLEEPSKEFFKKEKFTLKNVKKKVKDNLVYIKVEAIGKKDDVAGAKMLKGFEHLKKKLRDFKVEKSNWDFDEGVMWFEVKSDKLPKKFIRKGPPVYVKKHAEEFKKKHKDCFVEDGRLMAEEEREITRLKSYVKKELRDDWYEDKIKVKEIKVK